jgi:plasmid stabilization system protein ParE
VNELVYSTRAVTDLETLVGAISEQQRAKQAVKRISEAVRVLGEHPLIGRRAELGLRELVISHGETGYIALYRYLPSEEAVLLLAVSTQEEAGYADPDAVTAQSSDRG